MKVLFDHCTPRGLKRYMPEHEIDTAMNEGWNRLKNGILIDKAVGAGYQVLVTADKKMRHQQNIPTVGLGIVLLTRPNWKAVKTQIPAIRKAIAESKPGYITVVEIPRDDE